MRFLKLIYAWAIVYFLAFSGNANGEEMKKYYPLGTGYKWVYEIITEKEGATEEVEITGKEYVGNVETVKMAYKNLGPNYVASDTEGVKVYKEIDADDLSYKIYEPALNILPFNIEKDGGYKGKGSYSEYLKDGKLIRRGSFSEEIWLKEREDIIVPAGSFKECLKLFTVLKWKDENGNFGEKKIETWLAKDIGVVNMRAIYIEYIVASGDMKVDVDIEEWRLKNYLRP